MEPLSKRCPSEQWGTPIVTRDDPTNTSTDAYTSGGEHEYSFERKKQKKKKNKNERKKKIWGNKASSSFAKARSRCCNSHEPRVLCAEPKRSVRSDLQYTYIYMYEFDKRQFRRVVLENTGSFRRIKLLSTRIDHVSLHREECILHLVFDLKYISSFVGIAFTLTWVGNYTDSERTVIAYPFER